MSCKVGVWKSSGCVQEGIGNPQYLPEKDNAILDGMNVE